MWLTTPLLDSYWDMSSLIDCQIAVYFDVYSVYLRVVIMDVWIDGLKGSSKAVQMHFCLGFQRAVARVCLKAGSKAGSKAGLKAGSKAGLKADAKAGLKSGSKSGSKDSSKAGLKAH